MQILLFMAFNIVIDINKVIINILLPVTEKKSNTNVKNTNEK